MQKSKVRKKIEWGIKVLPLLFGILYALSFFGSGVGADITTWYDTMVDFVPVTEIGNALRTVADYFGNYGDTYVLDIMAYTVGYWVTCDIVYLIYDILTWLINIARGWIK